MSSLPPPGLAAIIGLLATLPLTAQSPETGRRGSAPAVAALDLDGDRVIDAAELAKATASLKKLDLNGDGQLTRDEYRSGTAPANNPSPAPPAQAPAPSGEHPNILVLIADDLGWNGVGFHHPQSPTPALNRLATEGTELTRFYTYPVCSPTRAAFLSGQMPRRFGIVDALMPRDPGLPAGTPTLATAFHAAGYRTSLVGKWHLGNSSLPAANGFDSFYGFLGGSIDYFKHTNARGDLDWQRDGQPIAEDGYTTDLIAAETIRQIQRRDPARPFFIQVAFNAPHPTLAAPAALIEKHGSGDAALYAAVIEALDTAIGRILATIDAQQLRDDTLVLFFSDNGAGPRFSSNAPFREGKDTLYEGGIRTPCVIRWPGTIPSHTTSAQPVSVHDLFPTLAEAARIPPVAKTDGTSQWTALRSGKTVPRDPILIASRDLALIHGDWKLIEAATGTRTLHNLATDPGETSDQLAAKPAVAADLTARLEALKKPLPPAPPKRSGK